MDLAQLANLGEFIGGIAVVVTLLYLAVQVRGNTKSERAETHRSFVEQLNRTFLTPMQDLEKAALFRRASRSFRGLSGDEQMVVSAFWQGLFLIAQEAHFLHQAGSIDDELAATVESFTVAVLKVPGVGEWWEEAGHGHTPSFRTHINDLRDSDAAPPPLTETWSWLAEAPPAEEG